MIEPGTVVAVLRRLQTEVSGAAAALGHALPTRQYVTTGGAVYDCEQVSVSANSITSGAAGSPDAGQPVGGQCDTGWNVSIEMAVVRAAAEMPVGRRGTSPPTVECIEADTDNADRDAAVLSAAVEAVAGPGWDQYGNVPASIMFGEVQGGLTAVVLSVTLNLWMFPEAAQ